MKAEHLIRNCTCFNARRAARALGQLYDRALAPAGIGNAQFTLLAATRELGPVPISRLATHLGTDRTTLTRNLRVLRERSLVTIAPGRDARTREVSLAPDGEAVLEAAVPLWRAQQTRIVAGVGHADWAATLDRLHLLHRLGESPATTEDATA
jgi:DNA-binding MarR family transcriptional regulator